MACILAQSGNHPISLYIGFPKSILSYSDLAYNNYKEEIPGQNTKPCKISNWEQNCCGFAVGNFLISAPTRPTNCKIKQQNVI